MKYALWLVNVCLVLGLAGVQTARGATIYAASYRTDALYAIDTMAGTVEMIGETGFGVDFVEGGLALNSAGELYGAFSGNLLDQLYTIDITTGEATPVGDMGYLDVSGLAFSPEDTLYGIDSENDLLITIDPTTGAGTLVGDGDPGIGVVGTTAGLACAPNGTLYMADVLNDSLYAFENLAASDPTATLIGALELDRVTGMTFALEEERGVNLYIVQVVADSRGTHSELFTLDWDTLELQPVQLADGHVLPDGIGGLAAVIPEPGTLVLLGMGGLATLLRRRHETTHQG